MYKNKFEVKGFIVWGICCLFFLYEYFLRTVIGSFQNELMQELKISSLQFSLLSSTIFFIMYGLMQIPVGVILDNFGLKKSMAFGAFLCSISCIGFGVSFNFSISIFFRALMGLGSAFGFIGLLVSIYEWMPKKYYAIFIGFSQFIGTLGPMLAAGPLSTIIKITNTSWRSLFYIFGVIGLLLTVCILLFIEKKKVLAGKNIIVNKPVKIYYLLKYFKKKEAWMVGIVSSCLYFTIEYFSENEGRNFLLLKGYPLNIGAYFITISWLGYAIGNPLLGFLSDMLQRRKVFLILTSLVGVFAVSSILFLYGSIFLIIAFFFLGIAASGQTISFANITELYKKQFVSFGFGLNNAIITLFSSFLAPMMGLAFDVLKGNGQIELKLYIFIFSFLIIVYIVAAFISLLFIKESYCKSQVDYTFIN